MNGAEYMSFTHDAYRNMLSGLKEHGYRFCGYRDWGGIERPVILRHDIDFELAAALSMAELESREGVKSTYFVLLRTDFYNPLERRNVEWLRKIKSLGHDIGLHFDETQYNKTESMPSVIKNEVAMLENTLDLPIQCVSMHRPSKKSLEANWDIPGVTNSYAKEFFENFEYISDSRRHWHKGVMKIIREEFPCLHILTHPFWYGEVETSLKDSLERFIKRAPLERMSSLDHNFTGLDAVLGVADVMAARLTCIQGERFDAERLTLRPLRLEDAADMFEYTSKPEVSKFLNWESHREAREARAWIASKLTRPESNDLLLGIEVHKSRKLIGTVRAYNFDTSVSSCEISYALNPAFQGHGLMGEALQKLVDVCSEKIGVSKVIARIDKDNDASARVASRLGMTRLQDEDFIIPIKGENRLQDTYVLERRQ